MPSILDYLNEDCWRCVLEYVSLKDIICSERVSRQWQAVVLTYLQGIHIGLETSNIRISKTFPNTRILQIKLSDSVSIESWTQKLGPSIVATFCYKTCIMITKYCPNVEALTLVGLNDEQLSSIEIKHFEFLQQLRLYACSVSDDDITRFIAHRVLEELEISDQKLTGECLNSIELSGLKCLTLFKCRDLEARHLLSAGDRLCNLRKLELEMFEKCDLFLEKLRLLEHLHIWLSYKNDRRFDAVCRLGKLKHLAVGFHATDEDVVAVAVRCTELRCLELINCNAVTARGVKSLCQIAGPRLTMLSFKNHLTLDDDTVTAVVEACPNLTTLDVSNCWCLTPTLPAPDVSNCWCLTPTLPARLAAARRRLCARAPLLLRFNQTSLASYGDPVLCQHCLLVLESEHADSC